MADLKYYSLSLVFHGFSFLSFFFAVCRTRHYLLGVPKKFFYVSEWIFSRIYIFWKLSKILNLVGTSSGKILADVLETNFYMSRETIWMKKKSFFLPMSKKTEF